jgi:hypothetical protein
VGNDSRVHIALLRVTSAGVANGAEIVLWRAADRDGRRWTSRRADFAAPDSTALLIRHGAV